MLAHEWDVEVGNLGLDDVLELEEPAPTDVKDPRQSGTDLGGELRDLPSPVAVQLARLRQGGLSQVF